MGKVMETDYWHLCQSEDKKALIRKLNAERMREARRLKKENAVSMAGYDKETPQWLDTLAKSWFKEEV